MNPGRPLTSHARILALLADGKARTGNDIASEIGMHFTTIYKSLNGLLGKGAIKRTGHHTYQLVEATDEQDDDTPPAEAPGPYAMPLPRRLPYEGTYTGPDWQIRAGGLDFMAVKSLGVGGAAP
jgi:biotin operon repressor